MASDLEDILIHGLLGRSRDEEEMVGHEEILGDEILGMLAAASSKIKGGGAFQNALAAKLAKRAPIVQKVQPTKKRRYTIGLGPMTIPPGTTGTVQTQPQVLFRGEKLINTGDVTGLFIQGIFVGNKAQLPTFQNAIAVKTYEGTVLDNEQLLSTCDPALFITFQVQNNSAVTATFAMSVVGHASSDF